MGRLQVIPAKHVPFEFTAIMLSGEGFIWGGHIGGIFSLRGEGFTRVVQTFKSAIQKCQPNVETNIHGLGKVTNEVRVSGFVFGVSEFAFGVIVFCVYSVCNCLLYWLLLLGSQLLVVFELRDLAAATAALGEERNAFDAGLPVLCQRVIASFIKTRYLLATTCIDTNNDSQRSPYRFYALHRYQVATVAAASLPLTIRSGLHTAFCYS